jgi:hypothetical protein
MVDVIGHWPEPGLEAATRSWVKSTFDSLTPFGSGAYVNFMSEDDSERSKREAYGGPGDDALRKRRIDDSACAVLAVKAVGRAKDAAAAPDVLAKDHHALVARLRQLRLVVRVARICVPLEHPSGSEQSSRDMAGVPLAGLANIDD